MSYNIYTWVTGVLTSYGNGAMGPYYLQVDGRGQPRRYDISQGSYRKTIWVTYCKNGQRSGHLRSVYLCGESLKTHVSNEVGLGI